MLLKGIAEVQGATRPAAAAEMVLVRIAYVADFRRRRRGDPYDRAEWRGFAHACRECATAQRAGRARGFIDAVVPAAAVGAVSRSSTEAAARPQMIAASSEVQSAPACGGSRLFRNSWRLLPRSATC